MKYNQFDYEVLIRKNYELALKKRTKIYYHYLEKYPMLVENLTLWSVRIKDFHKHFPRKDMLIMIKCNRFINEYEKLDKKIKKANARLKRNAYKKKILDWQLKQNPNHTSL